MSQLFMIQQKPNLGLEKSESVLERSKTLRKDKYGCNKTVYLRKKANLNITEIMYMSINMFIWTFYLRYRLEYINVIRHTYKLN